MEVLPSILQCKVIFMTFGSKTVPLPVTTLILTPPTRQSDLGLGLRKGLAYWKCPHGWEGPGDKGVDICSSLLLCMTYLNDHV